MLSSHAPCVNTNLTTEQSHIDRTDWSYSIRTSGGSHIDRTESLVPDRTPAAFAFLTCSDAASDRSVALTDLRPTP
jgi:hypothetical protein